MMIGDGRRLGCLVLWRDGNGHGARHDASGKQDGAISRGAGWARLALGGAVDG
uniref:Uncharacterized protein n=1 Tax=Arundo donax TaxID=35708 RepID=A0A0A9GHD6_ARUDO